MKALKNLVIYILMGLGLIYLCVIAVIGFLVLAPFALLGYLVDPHVRDMNKQFSRIKERSIMSNTGCICLERIGDNGPCPEHGDVYAIGVASEARDIATIELSIKMGCFIGERLFVKGDILTARNLGNGLWAISSPSMELRDFVHLNTQDVNKLAGFELIKEA